MHNDCEEEVTNYLKQSDEIQKLIKVAFDSDNYTVQYHKINRDQFLNTFKIRLRNLESQGSWSWEKATRLKSLIENFEISSDDNILCIGINNYELAIFSNTGLTKMYGYTL